MTAVVCRRGRCGAGCRACRGCSGLQRAAMWRRTRCREGCRPGGSGNVRGRALRWCVRLGRCRASLSRSRWMPCWRRCARGGTGRWSRRCCWGLRHCEVLELRLADLQVGARRVFIAEGKGGHQRLIPISGRFFTSVASYLDTERPAEVATDRLFVVLKGPRRGQPLSPAGLDQILDSARQRAGLAQATCHQLRHTCLTRLETPGRGPADPRPGPPRVSPHPRHNRPSRHHAETLPPRPRPPERHPQQQSSTPLPSREAVHSRHTEGQEEDKITLSYKISERPKTRVTSRQWGRVGVICS
jgi:Phage integrase family